MLRSLTIKNFALIKEISLDFDRGLNILTGETGAGKSVIVDAIMVLLGERASTDYIRQGEKKAIIEGIFEIEKTNIVKNILLENHHYDGEDEIIIRREILDKGSSRCFVNDSPISLAVLKQIGDFLVDFHGQHDHQLLIRPEHHLDLLDIIADVEVTKKDYYNKYTEIKELINNYKEFLGKEIRIKERREQFEFELKNLKSIDPQQNEYDTLENELRVLQNIEMIHNLTNELISILYNDESNIRASLHNSKKILEQLSKIDNAFSAYLGEFKSAIITIDEVGKYIQDYSSNIEYDEKRIEDIRLRLLKLNGLKKKYGSYEGVFERIEYLEKELSVINNFDDEIKSLEKKIKAKQEELSNLAKIITNQRIEACNKFSKMIKVLLADLGIPNVEFYVALNREILEVPSNSELYVTIENQNYKAYANGCDKAEFFISTNKGEVPKPLSFVASGGEISRVMLAIKTIVAEADNLPILIFDEIDTGISGRIAQKVGIAMKQLAAKHQIIAITHLPQIAAKGDRNFNVKKIELENKTIISCECLNDVDKVKEIAKLISGEVVTEKALESAKELLK